MRNVPESIFVILFLSAPIVFGENGEWVREGTWDTAFKQKMTNVYDYLKLSN